IPSPPLPVSSLPLALPPPTVDSPTYVEAPLGYRAARIWLRAASPSTQHPSNIPSPPLLLPSTSHRADIPEADMPLQKRACFAAPASGFEVGDSLAATVAGQPGFTLKADLRRDRVREMGYGITNTWDEIVEANQRVTELATTVRDRRFHRHTARLLDLKDGHSRGAWSHFMNCSKANVVQTKAGMARTAMIQERVVKGQNELLKSVPTVTSSNGNALTWWNSHVKTVIHEVAYAMTWKTLKKMMTDKYCPRGEMKKLEIEL
nr:reverse transcriptase domain-containing protein [Tanacetum cinerariifolium]